MAGRIPLAKIISRGPDGGIVKKAPPPFSAGSFETVTLNTESPGAAARLCEILASFAPNQALSPSLSLGAESGEIATVQKLRGTKA